MASSGSSGSNHLSSYSAHGRFHSSHHRRDHHEDDDEMPDDEPGFITSNSVHSRFPSSGPGQSSPPAKGGGSKLPPPASYTRPPAPRPVVSPDHHLPVKTPHGTTTGRAASPSLAAGAGGGAAGGDDGARRLSQHRPWRSTHGPPKNGAADLLDDGATEGGDLMIGSNSVSGVPSKNATEGGGGGGGSPFDLMASDIEQRLAESKARLAYATNVHSATATGGTSSTGSTGARAGAGSSNKGGPRMVTPTNADLALQRQTSSSGLNSRWDQFSEDPNLDNEAALATGTAIASAATSAARREVRSQVGTGEDVMVLHGLDGEDDKSVGSSGSRSLYERSGARGSSGGSSGGGSGSNIGNGGLLSKARTSARNLMGSNHSDTPSSPSNSNSASNRHSLSPHDAVRLQAMQMLQLAGGADDSSDEGSAKGKQKMAMSRNPRTGGYSAHPVGQRNHASISGLDMSLSASEDAGADKDRHFSIGDDDDHDRAARGLSSPYRDNAGAGGGLGDEVTFEEEPNMAAMAGSRSRSSSPAKKGSNWSSRYSVDRHLMFLTGGKDSRDLMNEMDTNVNVNSASYSARQRDGGRSATGMYRASAYDMKSAGSSAGAASTQRDYAHKNKTKVPKQSLKERWLDSPGNHSLPPPPHRSQTGGNYLVTEEIRRKKRRRLCIGSVILVAIAAIIGSLYGTTFKSDGSALSSSAYWNVGEPVTFYVTSDVPYNQAEEERLSRDLTNLPGDAEFVVHLGDVGLASTTSCAESTYEDASSILKTSRAPVFVLPGNQDWNECPNPELGFSNWMTHFRRFEDNFSHSFAVTRQLGRDENFSFLHNGVLFIGLHLVDGTIPDRTEWNIRHQECVQWAEQALHDFGEEQYRAIVMLGHSRPTALLGDFFWPIINDLNEVNKPVLYVHGNAMQGWTVYKPFSDASRLKAVELEKGGRTPPVKIRVGMGSNPFSFDRRSSNNS